MGAPSSGPIYRHCDEKLLAGFSVARIAKDNELSSTILTLSIFIFAFCSGEHLSHNRQSSHSPYTPTSRMIPLGKQYYYTDIDEIYTPVSSRGQVYCRCH